MLTLKFNTALSKAIVMGEKTYTWRLFPEQNFISGRTALLINSDTQKPFALARLQKVYTKCLQDLSAVDACGTNPYGSLEEILTTFQGFYAQKVEKDTRTTVIHFRLLEILE